jgi:hypothetical protein
MAARTTRKPPAPSRNGRSPPPSQTGSDGGGRLPDGRFAVGNKLSKGNPFSRRLAGMRVALLDAVGEDQLKRVAAKLVTMAEGGDVGAATLLLRYVVGRPAKCVNPDTLDLRELRLVLQAPDVETTCSRGQVHPALAVAEVLRNQVATAEQLIEALQSRMQELREEVQRHAGVDDWLEIQELARAAGLDGDGDDEGEGADDE